MLWELTKDQKFSYGIYPVSPSSLNTIWMRAIICLSISTILWALTSPMIYIDYYNATYFAEDIREGVIAESFNY